jgi:hypothetical protein
MIKTNLGTLHEAVPAITALLLEKIKVTQAYRLSKIAKEVQTELVTLAEQRTKILKELGVEHEGVEIPPAKQNDYLKSMTELLSISVEINLDPIKLSDIEEANITTQHMFNMLEAGIIKE